jgi:hypothetical protein
MCVRIDCPESDQTSAVAEVTYSNEVILTQEEIDEIVALLICEPE